MSYNGTLFLPTQTVVIVLTDAALQALPSNTSVVGLPYFSQESGLYYFSRNLFNPGINDLLANDNIGIYKFANPQSFLYLDNNNQVTNLNANTILNEGQILQGNSSNVGAGVTVSGAITIAPGGIASLGSSVSYVSRVIAQGTWSGTPISGPPAVINVSVSGIRDTDFPVCGITTSPISLSSDVCFLQQAAIYSSNVITMYLSTNPGPLAGWYMVFRAV